MAFKDDVPDLLPPWMQGPNSRTLWGSFGQALDENAATIMFARLQAVPFAGGANPTRQGAARLRDGRLIECELFVLPIHSSQRGILLYPNESTISRRVRLARFLLLHARRGTHRGEMEHLQPYFLPDTLPTIRIFHQSGGASPQSTAHTLDPAGVYTVDRSVTSNWDWDGNGTASAVPLAPAWAFSRIYAAGALVTHDGGKLYLCTTGGTSAGPGLGPTGTGQAIVDGGVTWQYRWAWSRWWAIIYLGSTSFPAPAHWDDGIAMWDDGVTIWGGAPIGFLKDWIAMLRDWGAAHAACWGVGITWADPATCFPPTGTSTTDPAGWTSRPVGNYGFTASPTTGLATRRPDVDWVYDRSQP